MLQLDQIDLPELADLLAQHDFRAGYLNQGTGEVHPVFDGQIIGLDEDGPVDAYDAEVEAFIELGGEDGHHVFRDMELFADRVGDPRTRGQLNKSLEGPKPMRAFRSVVHSTPEILGRTWERFRSFRAQLRALDFLGEKEFGGAKLVADAELEERRAQLIGEADALLEGLGRGPLGRLILLNGLPGVGKSTLSREYVATRPGTLNLDIDVLRSMLGGPWEETTELGRSIAIQIIEAHLESGHDVVVPQLIANPDQLRRFERAAAGCEFVFVLVQGESRPGDEPWRSELTVAEMRWYAENLDRLAEGRDGVRRLQVAPDDVSGNLADLERLLQTQ